MGRGRSAHGRHPPRRPAGRPQLPRPGRYRSADGRMVRWGQLYRSGSMVGLTEADYGYLSSLGILVICDFRSTAERTQEPTRWPGPS
ncbi:tyrosine-protein phosphatase, partial [Phenylobacterium sp.]|uniref:tyrosine-protein phosphatase n=1 Tax=Phenylobacterium sp. TaxID=1871053 RepID=UPI0039C9BC63